MVTETLALADAAEVFCWLSKFDIRTGIIDNEDVENYLPIVCFTDSQQFSDSLPSLPLVHDKRLRLEMEILREMTEKRK